MNFVLIENGDLYTPRHSGIQFLLLADRTIPHAHIIGAGGEEGFASRMPEILAGQIVGAGITTVVGLLGTDTMTRNMSCLHAKASQLCAEGITSYIYTGGFELPPKTLTGAVVDDLIMIDKIIGTGEIAISDPRWLDPEPYELAHIVAQTSLGGKMASKAGVVHFHTGPGKRRLALLHELLDCYDLPASSLYPTHINRIEALTTTLSGWRGVALLSIWYPSRARLRQARTPMS